METVHLLISGKVQGVNFRYSAAQVADKLKITGWIKNTKNETVEAMVSGSEEAVKDFVNWCKKGPEKAAVAEVAISKQPQIFFDGFRIIRN